MNNIKTGAFIKGLRKEKGSTQKDIAELLHVTDKAISKWERGLCAPDISLLEPLASALDVSIIELIKGERADENEHAQEIEATTKSVIDYSKNVIAYKAKFLRKKYLITAFICVVIAIAVCLISLWRSGYFFIIDRSVSPDGNTAVTVYDRDIFSHDFFRKAAAAVLVQKKGQGDLQITYGDCAYKGIWWAPDSKKYVMALQYDDEAQFALAWLERNAESNLNAYLSMGVEMNELAEYGFQHDGETPFAQIDYQFLQWSLDSSAMLIYYSFTDVSQTLHSGYFWYDCENGTVYAPFELDADQPA